MKNYTEQELVRPFFHEVEQLSNDLTMICQIFKKTSENNVSAARGSNNPVPDIQVIKVFLKNFYQLKVLVIYLNKII